MRDIRTTRLVSRNSAPSGCAALGCIGNSGCFIAVLLFNLLAGYWLAEYFFENVLGHHINGLLAIVVGLFTSEFLVPVDIILWVAQAVGAVHFPLLVG